MLHSDLLCNFSSFHILGWKLSKDNGVVANHVPLLSLNQIARLDGLSEDLNLVDSADQEEFVSRINSSNMGMDADRTLEYLVHIRNMPIGHVLPDIRLSCTTARSIHWGRVQLERYKERNGQSVDAKVSTEMAGAVA